MTLLAEERIIAGNVAKTVGVLMCVGVALAVFSIYLSSVV